MSKELEVLALNGDENVMKALQERAKQNGKKLIIMHRLLQAHYYSTDAVKWHFDTIIWSPWHQIRANEPHFYIDSEDGKAFRTVKTERCIEYVDSKLLDPEEIPRLFEKNREKRASLDDLQKMLEEAIKEEKYEQAANIRDEIKVRLEAKRA